MSFSSDFEARSAEIDEHARFVEQCADPATRNAALGLLRSTMELHKSALEEILEIIAEKRTDGASILEAFVRRPLIHSILMLHDLHPDSLEERIARALEELQPKLRRHNAEARLISIADGVVRVSLAVGHQHGSNGDTLKSTVEKMLIDAAPDAEILIESAPEGSNFVPIDALIETADHSVK